MTGLLHLVYFGKYFFETRLAVWSDILALVTRLCWFARSLLAGAPSGDWLISRLRHEVIDGHLC